MPAGKCGKSVAFPLRSSFAGRQAIRCYFLRGGHIADVEMLSGLNVPDAIAKAHHLYLRRKDAVDGFEVWDRTRVVVRHPGPYAGKPQAGAKGNPAGAIS
jgi:hypothetical protein